MLEIISNSSPGILRTPKSAENRGEFNSDDEKAVWICFRRCDGDIERMSGAWKAVRCRWEDLKDLQMMSGAWKAVRCLGEDLKDLQMMSGAFEDVRDLSKVSGTFQRPSDGVGCFWGYLFCCHAFFFSTPHSGVVAPFSFLIVAIPNTYFNRIRLSLDR